jgi:hypothetical protein
MDYWWKQADRGTVNALENIWLFKQTNNGQLLGYEGQSLSLFRIIRSSQIYELMHYQQGFEWEALYSDVLPLNTILLR